MKALITTFGTDGDTNPFIALALAMRARGDEPVLLLNPIYEEAVRRLGLPFIPIGEPWHVDGVADKTRFMHPLKGPGAVLSELFIPRIAPTYRIVADAIRRERPDAVVSHVFSFGASWAARAAGVPDAVMTLSPCMWMSDVVPPRFTAVAPPRWLRPWVMGLFRAFLNRLVGGLLKAPCAELGVPWRRDWLFANFAQASLNLALWSKGFRSTLSDDPPQGVICGFPVTGDSTATSPLAREVQAFLDAGPPPVVVGLGTSARDLGGAVYAEAAAACEALGERCLLVGPPRMEGLPSTSMAVRSAPYVPLFARAKVVIHHGGINTTAETMRAGVPSIVVPFGTDQFDNAERAQDMGASLLLTRRRATRRRIAEALRSMMEPARLARAKEIATLLQGEGNGAARAAELVAGLAKLQRPRAVA